MKISKSIILPEFESIESLEQAGEIIHKMTEAMKDHQIENYEDAVASYRRITTGRIESRDGETYFDLDSGVIRGEIVFRKGSSGLDNIEEAKPNDWDNAFRLANSIKGDDDFTLISGGKIITKSIAVGAFKSDVIARMFSGGDEKKAIEDWMEEGHITWIDGSKIWAGSIKLTGLGTTIIDGGKIVTGLLTADNIRTGTLDAVRIRVGGETDEDIYFKDSHIRMYDGLFGNYKRINWKYNTFDFAKLYYKSDTGETWFYLYSSGYHLYLTQQGNISALRTSGYELLLGAGDEEVRVYDTGQLDLTTKTNAPTSNNYGGCIICDSNGQLHIYTTAWRHINSSSGW